MIEMYSQPTVRRAIATHIINTTPAPGFFPTVDRRKPRRAPIRLRYVLALIALGFLLSLLITESWI